MSTAVATHAPTASTGGFFKRIGSFLVLLGAVHRVKIAVESHRQPAADDLLRLGIDPAQMPRLDQTRV
ncbi:hypothetical protein [Falsirhodobacter deserti]|uniref:hypothetical protein n=1 Tax=Falsirhodobacter deserti TaxID=1365611 RepID=UPI000FE37869|nr:hypothetical protein [Falsirhodobacter deserti]